MKKIFLYIMLFLSLIFTSCSFGFQSLSKTDDIQKKNTYKKFENLNRPIVFTMPIYEEYALFGNPNLNCQEVREGDIFVIYDWENDCVYDWVFFKGNHGWANWRSSEMSRGLGENVSYYSACPGSGKIGCLNPCNTKLEIYDYEYPGTFECKTNAIPIVPSCALITASGFDSELNKPVYYFEIFNATTGKCSKEIGFPTDSIGFIPPAIPDKNGNYWLIYNLDESAYLSCIDTSVNEIKQIDKFPVYEDNSHLFYHVLYADSNKLFTYKQTYEEGAVFSNQELQRLYLYNIDENELNEINIPAKDIYYINSVVEVCDKYIAICPHEILDDNVDLYEIDIENKKSYKICTIPIDMTESVYVRGNRLYLMSSRSLSDVKIMYYDFKTKELSDTIRIRLDDIINETY